jgi:two-component system, cell cycle sensor histidine kinase and response regulator CckA
MGPEDRDARVQALEAEVRVLRTLLQNAPDFITRITVDGKFLYLNRLAPGFTLDQVLGTSVDAYVPPQYHEQARAAMQAACLTRTVQQYATVGQISAQRMGHYLTRVSPIVEDGAVTSLVMTATDVTALEEQRVHLQLALDASELGIWSGCPQDDSGTWDERTRRIFGVAEGTPARISEVLEQRIHPADRGLVLDALSAAQITGHYGPLQHRIVRPGGAVRWVNTTGLTVRDHEGQLIRIIGSVQDVTERRALEERLLEAQKLESIGRLAGGVAHDFNNMLTAVFGNVEFALEASSMAEVRPLLEAIRVTAERSAALTAQLLAFARRQVIEPKVLDLNALVTRFDTMFRRAIGAHVEVVLSLKAKACIRADASQLEQVVMNLVTNARDAMSHGGVIEVATRDVTLDDEQACRIADLSAGPYVVLRVTDSGAGISADSLPHVFEPFFTTRTGGTGLGLATCYGIVKQNGGHILVTSELGHGTTFEVYLPSVDAEATATRRTAAVRDSDAHERILIVEDETAVRKILEKVLTRQGYHVTSASTAEEALRLAKATEPFDLLITDVVLPGMGGHALSQQLAQAMPHLRVLFVSGYTESGIVNDGVLDAGVCFLQKPFAPPELLRAARQVLDQ